MCGIAGYFGPYIPNREQLSETIGCLKHRGPDGHGIYTNIEGTNSVALIHRRLAIIDLEARSNQPFRLRDHILVFNGEIYNYLEVREKLISLGHVFLTDGDTEVLAHALLEWGEKGLDKLEGMWAFAWYDEQNRSLLLSRDRFGEKPLYLWRRNNGLYFSSEIKGLAALSGQWPEVNENHLIRYLINGYKAIYKTSETFHLGVEELPIGTTLVLNDLGHGKPQTYWTPKLTVNENMTYEEAVALTREGVINSVKLRMRSDVPLAFCMSGGVDSNSLISIARKELNLDVHGYTIVNTDKRYEERDLVKQVVEELGISQTNVELERENFLDNLQKLIVSHDAPVYTISYYVHWKLMQAIAKDGYKVTISGTGADELFTGYYDHHNLYLYEVAGDTDLHSKSLESWRKHQASVVRNPYLQNPDLYINDPGFRAHIFLNNDEFAKYLHKPWAEAFTETNFATSLLRTRMLNELFVEGSRVILHEDDLNAMYFSMENRSPFLDRNLFEIAYSIPVRHLVQDGMAKSVLRDAMRGIVPDIIVDNRTKVGFNAPILDLIDVSDPAVREFLLDDSPVYNIVRKDKIEELLTQKKLLNSESKFLFYFLNMKLFLDTKH